MNIVSLHHCLPLKVLWIAVEENDGGLAWNISVTQRQYLASGCRHGNFAEPGVRIPTEVPHAGSELLSRYVHNHCLPVTRLHLIVKL